MSGSMLAAVLHGARDLRVEQRAVPPLVPGTVLVRVRRGGLCGSDVHYFEHGRVGNFVLTAPFVLGHEICGEVVERAEGVESPAVGQRVVVNPARHCGQCHHCRSGRVNLCRRVQMLGSASTRPHTDGGFAEYVRVGAEQCFAMPEGMDDGLGALMEPFAVALHAVSRAGSVAGRTVLVSGGGPIGLLTTLAARAFGATLVALTDPVAGRRGMAQRLGADAVLDPTVETFAAEAARVAADGFEVLFEASGAPGAVRQAFSLARHGGTIVQIGSFSVPEVPVPMTELLTRELQLLGSFRYGNVWEQAIRLAASGRVDLRPLVSDVFPLRQAGDAMDRARERGGALKVQLDMTQGPEAP